MKAFHKLYDYKEKVYLFAILSIFIVHAIYLSCIAEDAFITFQFAQNLANGHGLLWNIGEPPVEGYTNFLWIVICAFALKLGLNVALFAQTIGILSSLTTIIYVYNFVRRLLNCEAFYSLIPCLFLAASGPFATWATSGMETNIFGLFLIIGCYHFTSYWRFHARRDLFLCFVALLLATLTRPEGFMIFGILVAFSLVLSFTQPKIFLKDVLFPILLYITLFSIYMFWRIQYFGFLLPNTFYAKTGGTVYQYLRGVVYSSFFAIYFIFPLLLASLLLVWEKGILVGIRKVTSRAFIDHIKDHLGVYVCAIVCVLYTLYIIYVGGDYMAMFRFFVPFLPLIYVLSGPIMNTLLLLVASSSRKRWITKGVLIFALAATIVHSTPFERKLFAKPPLQHGTYRGVQTERWAAARLTLIGKFFNEYKRNSSDSLGTGAIGAIGYYTDMKIYGFHGLVDTHIAHKNFKDRVLGLMLPGHEKYDPLYVLLSKKPSYFMFSRKLIKKFPENSNNADKIIEFLRENYNENLTIRLLIDANIAQFIQENYKLSAVWFSDKQNHEEGYLMFLELKEHRE